MYSDVDNGWSKTFLKQFLKIFLCFTLIYTPFFAYAGAAEKWEVLENNYDHVTNKVKIEARKITQDAANSGRYKVEVPVSPSALGKTVKTMMWTGLAVAGVEAMLEGIGWIIDHGSKVIKRPLPPENPDENIPYCYYHPDLGCYGSASSLIQPAIAHTNSNLSPSEIESYGAVRGTVNLSSDQKTATVTLYKKNNLIANIYTVPFVQNPNYDPTRPDPEPQYEYLDDAGLGNEIIGNGENTQPLPDAVEEAYSPNNPITEPAPEASRRALDNANPQPEQEPKGESETEPETDPETGEATGNEKTTFQLPNFCTWAPAVCDFFTVQKADNQDIKNNQREQIEQDKTFFEKVNDWFDWTKENDDLDQDNEPPEIEQIDIGSLDTGTFKATAGCPAPIQVPVTFGIGGNVTISYEPICQFADKWSFVAPLIGFLSGAMILVGVGRKGEDGEI